MKKLLSCLLILAMFLSLSLSGAWSVQAKADAAEDLPGSYELVGMVVEGVDYTDQLGLAGLDVRLVVNADGTATLSSPEDVTELTWDEKAFTDTEGVAVPYTWEDGILTLTEDDTILRFGKADDSGDQTPADVSESPVGLWFGTMDMKPFIAEGAPDLAKFMDSVIETVTLELQEDGSYNISMDATNLIPVLRIAMVGHIEEMCEQNGITVEQYEAINGKTLNEIVEEDLASIDMSELSYSEDGHYVQDGIKLSLNEENTATYTGDIVTIELGDFGKVELTRAGIVGLWSASVKLGDLEGAEELPDPMKEVTFNRILELRSDNSFFLSLDRESFFRSYKDAVKATFIASLEENGATVEDAESVYGKPLNGIVEDLLAETDLSPLEYVLTGSFTEKDGELSGKADDGTQLKGSWSRSAMTLEIENYGTLNFTRLSAEDVLAKGEGAMSYAAYASAETDTPVVIEAYVQAHQDWWNDAISVYAQDAEGGYFIYNMACSEADAALLVPGQKIRVSGVKSEWSGEIEIVDATFEFVRGSYFFNPLDVTELVGKKELIEHQNQLVSFAGMTIEPYDDTGAAFAYKDPDGKTDDLYFKASKDGVTIEFTVEFYLCGKDTEVYKAVEGLQVGDTVDLECFLYWYNNPNPHVTAVIVK